MSKQGILLIGISILVLLGILSFFYLQKTAMLTPIAGISPTQVVQQMSPTVSQVSLSPSSSVTYCTPQGLQASLTLSPGAGNIYGTFTLKNIANHTCQVDGGRFISANYDTNSVKNISITHLGQTQSQPFILDPGQMVYSQVHYPNGPQCQSVGLNTTNVMFTYQISPADVIAFENQQGSKQQQVQTCKSSTDITEIQIWYMSAQPITP